MFLKKKKKKTKQKKFCYCENFGVIGIISFYWLEFYNLG